MNLVQHMTRVIEFSRRTWGPGTRRRGIVEHIRKELVELEQDPDHGDPAKEWVDVVILGLDGLWRELADQNPKLEDFDVADLCVFALASKQTRNENRQWPDWRKFGHDEAIEHVRD